MLSHGGHARELNIWASKLRNYKCKHLQRARRSPGYTLYCSGKGCNKTGEGNDDKLMLENHPTDLQRCVQLLSHLLETDGSLMGGPTVRKQVGSQTARGKKKRVHVVPQPKNVFGRGALIKASRGKANHNTKKARSKMTVKPRLQCGDSVLANDGVHSEECLTKPSSVHHDGVVDVSESVPYNTRLACSTPNNTVLNEQIPPEGAGQDTCHSVMVTGLASKADVGHLQKATLGKTATNTASGRKIVRESTCPRHSAPDLPLVFLNTEYNLTPGQSNPLNSSDQVNIIKPPQPESVPKLIQGRVEFKPNPLPCFLGNKSCVPRVTSDILSNKGPETASPSRSNQSRGCDEDVNHQKHAACPLDPPEKEVNFSLYTNVDDGSTTHHVTQQKESVTGSSLATEHKAANGLMSNQFQDPGGRHGNLIAETNEILTVGTSTFDPHKADAIKIPTGMRKSASEGAIDSVLCSSSSVAPQKETVKCSDAKVKRLAKKDSAVSCSRCTRFDKEKQPRKGKDGIRKAVKCKLKADKAVQFAVSNVATQCSPERVTEPASAVDVCTEPCMSQQSMRHMMALQCHLEELRSVIKPEENARLSLLLTQIEQTAAMFVPGLGGIDWRTELELAIQPLRSENAQLRRRLRISNQQMKEKTYQLEKLEKTDHSFHTVHMELLQHKMKQDLEEVKRSRDQLKERVKELQAAVSQLQSERTKLLEIMVKKDMEHERAEQKFTEDMARYRHDTERALEKTNRALRERDVLQNQLELVHISLEQRDKEIARLRNIVRNLQASMQELLEKLKSMTPPDEFVNTFVDGDGNNLLDSNVLVSCQEKRLLADDHCCDKSGKVIGSSSVRRVLPFADCEESPRHGRSDLPERKASQRSSEIMNVTSSPIQERKHEGRYQYRGDMVQGEEGFDNTEYITVPGTSALKSCHVGGGLLKAEAGRDGNPHGGAPTVKDLLTPLKDRLQTQYKRLSAESRGESRSADLPHAATVPASDAEDSQADLAIEPLDSTLVEESVQSEGRDGGEDVLQERRETSDGRISQDDVSRYSMTDYFKKYSRGLKETTGMDKHASRQVQEPTMPEHGRNVNTNNQYSGEIIKDGDDTNHREINRIRQDDAVHGSRSAPSGIGRNTDVSDELASFQEDVYKGTVLETSISTIDDAESVASSAMSLSSVGTIDDSNFQQGLADLDANIARIQAELQASLAQYS